MEKEIYYIISNVGHIEFHRNGSFIVLFDCL